MKNKKILLILTVLGLSTSLAAFVVRSYDEKQIAGAMFGIGFTLFGLSISRLLQLRFNEKHPEQLENRTIEENDERNIQITHRAQASAGKIQQYLIIGLAYVLILKDVEIYLIGLTVMVYLSFTLLTSVFKNSYNKKM